MGEGEKIILHFHHKINHIWLLCTSCHNLTESEAVKGFVTALINSQTLQPHTCSAVVQVCAFRDLFMAWPENHRLCLKHLSLKTLSLLALIIMLRPSDVPPNVVKFDPTSQTNFQSHVFHWEPAVPWWWVHTDHFLWCQAWCGHIWFSCPLPTNSGIQVGSSSHSQMLHGLHQLESLQRY